MRPCVLTIAGSDSGAGAGIQADSRVIHALGGFALTAVTAVTAQNGEGVRAWKAVTPSLVSAQVKAAVEGFPVLAAKTGLLPGKASMAAVANSLPRDVRLVVDPLLGSTSGTVFVPPTERRVFSRLLFPRAELVTPNWPEAEALLGVRIRTLDDARDAAVALLALGARAVLLKGGHGSGALSVDLLATSTGVRVTFASVRIRTLNTHGTGCVLSAAIAACLARGSGLVAAVEEARRFLQVALVNGQDLEWAGRGPAFAGW